MFNKISINIQYSAMYSVVKVQVLSQSMYTVILYTVKYYCNNVCIVRCIRYTTGLYLCYNTISLSLYLDSTLLYILTTPYRYIPDNLITVILDTIELSSD